ncbi:hypothetical protein B0H14DRAFT_3495333 [Mycena olivaceomarginata]|nr:hypothetical protein B0H14DRAFT_3495333 [Mycena olivaceomarginata]
MPRRSKRTTARVKKGGGPYLIDGREHWEVEKVLNTRKARGRKKWKGYPTEENSWVTGEDASSTPALNESWTWGVDRIIGVNLGAGSSSNPVLAIAPPFSSSLRPHRLSRPSRQDPGLSLENEIKRRNRDKLLDASSAAVFRKEVKRLSGPAPISVSVMADSLWSVFDKRLNPPEILPSMRRDTT